MTRLLRLSVAALALSTASAWSIIASDCRQSTALFSSSRSKSKSLEDFKSSYGESSRQYRRTVYTHDDWLRHRSPDRFYDNLASIFKSGITRQLLTELLVATSVALFVVAWNTVLVEGYTDIHGVLHKPLSTSYPLLSLPTDPFTLCSPALGLLLVFRTNSSGV